MNRLNISHIAQTLINLLLIIKMEIRTIILVVYNRPKETILTLQALKALHSIDKFSLLVIRQDGCDKVAEIINSIDWIPCTHKVTTLPHDKSVAYKINHNVRTGLHIAFEDLKSDYVIVVEDDVLLGYDFLFFCEQIHKRYEFQPKFRGINAFSKEPFLEQNLFLYGTFRYGVGQGWSINRQVWNQIKLFWLPASNQHFDALVEPWFRYGFVVMPYCSRSCNIGFGGSAHSPISEFDDYYVSMRKSWVGKKDFKLNTYVQINDLKYTWRNDCTPFVHYDLLEEFKFVKWKLKNLCKKIIAQLRLNIS
jgi:hypothetical protein